MTEGAVIGKEGHLDVPLNIEVVTEILGLGP
jgi:hypothetical protein